MQDKCSVFSKCSDLVLAWSNFTDASGHGSVIRQLSENPTFTAIYHDAPDTAAVLIMLSEATAHKISIKLLAQYISWID